MSTNEYETEIDDFDATSEDKYTKLFWKCYRKDFFNVLKVVKNQQLQIFIHICQKVQPSTNKFIGTYARMSKEIRISQATIAKMIGILKRENFIVKVQNGVWMVNPNMFMYGDDTRRTYLSKTYREYVASSQEAQEKKDKKNKNSNNKNFANIRKLVDKAEEMTGQPHTK